MCQVPAPATGTVDAAGGGVVEVEGTVAAGALGEEALDGAIAEVIMFSGNYWTRYFILLGTRQRFNN